MVWSRHGAFGCELEGLTITCLLQNKKEFKILFLFDLEILKLLIRKPQRQVTMADIILRVVQGHGFERGDAAMEFITALAIGKMRLHKKVEEKLRNNIKQAPLGKV
ncbi:hypothetical protein D3C79_640290 [compost metagenome]